MSIRDTAFDLVIDPADWFDRRGSHSPIRGPLTMVALVAGLRALAHVVEAAKESVAYQGSTTAYGVSISGGLFGLGFWPWEVVNLALVVGLGSLGMLTLYVGVIHAGTTLSGGNGSIRDSVVIVGWGYLPQVIGAIVSLAITIVIVQHAPTPTGPLQTGQFFRAIRTHPLFDLQGWLSWAFTVWSGFVWAVGIAQVHGLSLRRSVTISGTGVVLAFLAFRYVTPPIVVLIRLSQGGSILG